MDYDKGHLLHGGISCEGVEAFEGAARESFVGGGGSPCAHGCVEARDCIGKHHSQSGR